MKICMLALACTIDALHLPIALAFMAFPSLWLPYPYWVISVTATVMSQIVCLGCPLTIISWRIRRKYNPNYKLHGSFTLWLYHKYGRKVGLLVLTLSLFASILFGILALYYQHLIK